MNKEGSKSPMNSNVHNWVSETRNPTAMNTNFAKPVAWNLKVIVRSIVSALMAVCSMQNAPGHLLMADLVDFELEFKDHVPIHTVTARPELHPWNETEGQRNPTLGFIIHQGPQR